MIPQGGHGGPCFHGSAINDFVFIPSLLAWSPNQTGKIMAGKIMPEPAMGTRAKDAALQCFLLLKARPNALLPPMERAYRKRSTPPGEYSTAPQGGGLINC